MDSHSIQFVRSVAQSCLTLWDPMDCSTLSLPVYHQLAEFTQIHVHWVGDAIQPSHPLPAPSPPTFNLAQHQGLFQWVSFLHQVKGLEFQLQHQSFQWIFRTDLLKDGLVGSAWVQGTLKSLLQHHNSAIPCSPPGSSVHGTSQARLLEWPAISFSRGSSQPRDWTHVFCIGR